MKERTNRISKIIAVQMMVVIVVLSGTVFAENVYSDWSDWPDVSKTYVQDEDFMRICAIPEDCNVYMNFNLSNSYIDNLVFEEWASYWGESFFVEIDYNGGNISILDWSSMEYYKIIDTVTTGSGTYANNQWNWSLDPSAPALENLVNESGTVRIFWQTHGTEKSLTMFMDIDYACISTVEADSFDMVGQEWNLVSLPVDITMTAQELYVEIISQTDCNVVQISNWTGGGWNTHLPQISPSKNNFVIDKAVMIYVTNIPASGRVFFHGSDYLVDVNSYDVGWNLESWHCGTYMYADDVLTGVDASSVCRYNNSIPSWDAWDGSGWNFPILDNEGYFVLI